MRERLQDGTDTRRTRRILHPFQALLPEGGGVGGQREEVSSPGDAVEEED